MRGVGDINFLHVGTGTAEKKTTEYLLRLTPTYEPLTSVTVS
jgi:hypothetical protein